MRPYYERMEGGLGLWKVEVGSLENNLYLLWDEGSREAYVLDGGYEPEVMSAEIKRRRLRPRGILVTHGHRDHHENVERLKELIGAPVGIAEADLDMLSLPADFLIRDGDTFQFGDHALRAIHTPGHTPGSTCFLIGEYLFTGDTLFPGGPGNTKKDPVRFATIIESIRSRLFALPDETIVCPGHGRDTTIGAERPQLEEWIQRGW